MNFDDLQTFYLACGAAYGLIFLIRVFKSVHSKDEFHEGKTFKEWLDGEAQFVPEMLLAFAVALVCSLGFLAAVLTWPLLLGMRIYKSRPLW